MTSTSFNVGVDIDSKSSSRVLRPPGGGHSDIFGVKEPIVQPCRKEDNRRNASSILEGTNQEKPSDILQNAKDVQNGNSQNDAVQEVTKEAPKAAPQVQDQSAPRRDIDVSGRFSLVRSPQDGVVPHGLPMTPCLDLVTTENDFIKCEKEVVGTDESLIRT